MSYLAVDTSTPHASVALQVGDRLFTRHETELKKHAEWILPAIDAVLIEAGVALSSLQGLIFGEGPGSFTGLRVACAVAKGLALGAGLPLYAVSSLASIASQVPDEQVLAVLDARMEAWYWAEFKAGVRQGDMQVSAPSALSLSGKGKWVLAGMGFEALYDTLPEAIKHRITRTQSAYPTAESMIKIVRTGLIEPVSVRDAKPQYIRQKVT